MTTPRWETAVRILAWAAQIAGWVLLVVNDPHLSYGERRAGWELLLIVGAIGVLQLLWVRRNHRRWAEQDRRTREG